MPLGIKWTSLCTGTQSLASHVISLGQVTTKICNLSTKDYIRVPHQTGEYTIMKLLSHHDHLAGVIWDKIGWKQMRFWKTELNCWNFQLKIFCLHSSSILHQDMAFCLRRSRSQVLQLGLVLFSPLLRLVLFSPLLRLVLFSPLHLTFFFFGRGVPWHFSSQW